MRTTTKFFSLLVAATTLSCVQTLSSNVDLNTPVEDDRPYMKSYDASTHTHKVIKDFETRYIITATYLSPDFRTAFAKRYEQLYKDPQPVLDEASGKAGFFVTFFSPTNDGYDLENTQLWNIQMEIRDQKLKPVLVRRLRDKERWTPFFADVSPWSKEYLVLFDTPSVTPSSPDLVEKNPITLNFANADAHVKFNW